MAVKVEGTLETEIEVDLTPVLDTWTVEEVREFVEGEDDEGFYILKSEAANDRALHLYVDTSLHYKASQMREYLEERQSRDD